LLDLQVIHACESQQTSLLVYFKEQADVFSELAMHTESKMIIFTSGPLQGLRLFLGKCLEAVGKEAEMIALHQNEGFVRMF